MASEFDDPNSVFNLHHSLYFFLGILSNFVFQRPYFGFRQTDGRTDRQKDAINIFWAFLVKN